MSILPSLNLGTASSSSSSPSQSPTSGHGFCSSFDQSHPNPQISDSQTPTRDLRPSGQDVHDSGGSSKEVKGEERHNGDRSPIQQNGGKKFLHPHIAAHGQIGSSKWQGKYSGSQNSSGHSAGKKVQMLNVNHLLNFRYDPIHVSRPQPRAPPPRRYQKRKPYNKDLFFQANYRFVVLDSKKYAAEAMEAMDPDKMLCWEDIICLKYSTPFPVYCPICLDDPLCPQITSCGHIFCFPCILQYFSIGEVDLKDECWKKCPLCFTMISSKDLYTIHIENVKQYSVGDEIEFVLLTRQKDSFISSFKNNDLINIEDGVLDSFSKFTLTSDVDQSVREAMSDLDRWIARANSGLVDDIEKLPYVCTAIEQLERRKKYWNEQHTSVGTKEGASLYGSPPTAKYSNSEFSGKSSPGKMVADLCSPQVAEFNGLEDHERFPSSSADDNKSSQVISVGIKERKDGDSYNFYQAIDGQHLILHPLSMKCLLHHYGNYENLPNRITGKILQMETATQSEAIRRRYRFLSHFSLTTTFQLCEIDLHDKLPAESLFPFMDEIKNREKQRKQLARKELKEKFKAEVAGSQFVPVYSYNPAPSFSADDFEALGNSPAVASSSLASWAPTAGERQSFSSVTSLGFAAAYDSPSLKTNEVSNPPKIDMPHNTSGGSRDTGTSFATIASRANHVEIPGKSKANESGSKKGKKPSRVLMSTAGGRRY